MRRFVGLDPSTKTGFVAMDEHGNVLRQKELIGVGSEDPKRMATMIDEIMDHIKPGDVICIEGFGFASQQAVQNGGIGWGIRMRLFQQGFKYYEVAPSSLKKFVQATGRIDENGKALDKKKAVADGVYEHYGYTNSNNNIVDAYVLAQIAFSLSEFHSEREFALPRYQFEVIETVLTPVEDKKAAKAAAAKKKKEKAIAKANGTQQPKQTRSRAQKPAVGLLF